MAEARIPVDILNPGQVFACLGLMEILEILEGHVEGKFDIDENKFVIRTPGNNHPIESILDYLLNCEFRMAAPRGWKPWENIKDEKKVKKLRDIISKAEKIERIMCKKEELSDKGTDLPICITYENKEALLLYQWCNNTAQQDLKLYSGNRSAFDIFKNMLFGKDARNRNDMAEGVYHLYTQRKEEVIKDPLNTLVEIGGSFNFDPRGAWDAINIGYSIDKQKQKILSSPLIEILSQYCLQYTIPKMIENSIFYGIWGVFLPTSLCRVALGGNRYFCDKLLMFRLGISGKNKIVTYAKEVASND
jgi:CRISPR-associated protein Csx14